MISLLLIAKLLPIALPPIVNDEMIAVIINPVKSKSVWYFVTSIAHIVVPAAPDITPQISPITSQQKLDVLSALFLSLTAVLAPFTLRAAIEWNTFSSAEVTATPTISNNIPININTKVIIIPNIKDKCEVDVKSLFNEDSTNVYYKHWLSLANVIKENYELYDGFIICHGTDTMSYTASALSYLIQNSRKPIVLTGAQKPINLEISDAKTNLMDSFTYACSDVAKGVVIIFNGNVILGTRARKTRTKSFDAFSSIDYPRVAIVKDNHVIPYITNLEDNTVFYDKIDKNVTLLKLVPGMDSSILEFMLDKYDGVVIESFGVGGLPNYDHSNYNKLITKICWRSRYLNNTWKKRMVKTCRSSSWIWWES